MSNEGLAVLIQGGERDRLVELWAQVRRMALKEAAKCEHKKGGQICLPYLPKIRESPNKKGNNGK